MGTVRLDAVDEAVRRQAIMEVRQRRQKWHSGYHTKREAAAALAELVSSVNRGSYVPKTRQTLAQYIQEWLTAIAPTVKPSTHYSYSRNLRLHVVAYFGSTPLSAVDPGNAERSLRPSAGRGAQGPGCPRAVSAAYFVIATTAMRRGEALGLRWTDVDLEAGRAAIRPRCGYRDGTARASEAPTGRAADGIWLGRSRLRILSRRRHDVAPGASV